MAFKKEVPSMRGDVRSIDKKDFRNILIRIPNVLLIGLDLLLDEKPWINRTQWIVGAIHEKLKNDIKEE